MATKTNLDLVRNTIFGGTADSLADVLDKKDTKIQELEAEIEEKQDKIVDHEVALRDITEITRDMARGIRGFDELLEKIHNVNARFTAPSEGGTKLLR